MNQSANQSSQSQEQANSANTLAGIPPQEAAELKALYEQYNYNTEQLRYAFQRLERRFREIDPYNIYNSITEALITLDSEGNIITFNKAAEEIFEKQSREVTGKPFRTILPDCAAAFDDYQRSHSLENRYEIHLRTESHQTKVLRGRFSPLLDRNGIEIGSTGLFTDLSTERLLEEKARRQDRLAALGELAAGVAHEMRNPLTTVRGYLQILPTCKDDEEFIDEFSSNLIREIDRLTRLTENLLNMAKPISAELELTSLQDIALSVATFSSEKLEKNQIALHTDLEEQPTQVRVDVDRIKQVFLNLLLNAVEAMPRGGDIEMRFDRREETFSSDEAPKTFAVAEVIDNGPGIPHHQLERLFDPFFTTKNNGTGLGLSLSNRIVEEHGGFLRVESQEDRGAHFWIFIPMAREFEQGMNGNEPGQPE